MIIDFFGDVNKATGYKAGHGKAKALGHKAKAEGCKDLGFKAKA